MSNLEQQRSGLLARTWRKISIALAPEVSEAYATCAFLCNQPECQHDQWDSCTRRLNGMEPGKETA